MARRRRPRVRGDCANGPRPCPWVSCRYHLALHVTATGSIQIAPFAENNTYRSRQKFDAEEASDRVVAWANENDTCALDVAERELEGMTLEAIGDRLGGFTKAAIQLHERQALLRLRQEAVAEGLELPDGRSTVSHAWEDEEPIEHAVLAEVQRKVTEFARSIARGRK